MTNKKQLHMIFIKYAWLIGGMALLIVTGCKKKNDSPPVDPISSLAQVATAPVTAITASTAIGGGTVTSNGGATVTASGICWSRTNQFPVITDDTTKTTIASGSFTGNMTHLQSSVTYYVRAYAINSVGTAYGNVVSFNTANVPPIALDVTITGIIKVGETLRASYTYFDLEHNPESGTTFQWYVANDTTGGPVTTITNATNITYIVPAANLGKFLRVGIMPRASAGTSPGSEYRSYWAGPVGAAPFVPVTFTYNGQSVTYGVITSSVTGRKWLDRNLGAPNAPAAFDDWRNEGDLFQWGRGADGHQLINRAASTMATTAVNGSTATLSVSDNPGHALFITPSTGPFDWRSPQNANLWQTSSGINNVCPAGWHVPTKVEWEAESLGVLQDSYTQLNITTGGVRNFNGSFSNTVTAGQYWSSTLFQGVSSTAYAINFSNSSAASSTLSNVHSNGLSVRCIKD
jgi:hypothetical protein